MIDMKFIRNEFKKNFGELAKEKGIEVTNEWDLPIPEWDTILLKWKSEDVKKILSLQEEEPDSSITFCYVIDTTQVFSEKYGDEQYDHITILAKTSQQMVKPIFEIYKLWFLENKGPKEIEPFLEEYFTKLNGHSSQYYERLFEETHDQDDHIDKKTLIDMIESIVRDG